TGNKKRECFSSTLFLTKCVALILMSDKQTQSVELSDNFRVFGHFFKLFAESHFKSFCKRMAKLFDFIFGNILVSLCYFILVCSQQSSCFYTISFRNFIHMFF